MVQPFNSSSSRPVDGQGLPKQTTLRAVVGIADKTLRKQVAQALAECNVQVIAVSTAKTLDMVLEASSAGLLIVDLGLSKGKGLSSGSSMLAQHPLTRVIGVASKTDAVGVAQAFRAGFADVFIKPLDAAELALRLAGVVGKMSVEMTSQSAGEKSIYNRLTEASLSEAKRSRSLTPATIDLYQPGVKQPINDDHKLSPLARSFAGRVGDDLDLEGLIRHTLQMVLEITGPTNAAVFLPGSADEYSLGGYINHDFSRDNGQMVLEHLAQVLGPKVINLSGVKHMTSDAAVEAWAGDDAGYLADSQVLAVPAKHHAEAVAGLVFFRNIDKGFTREQAVTLEELASLFGERLARLIRVHHRAIDGQSDGL